MNSTPTEQPDAIRLLEYALHLRMYGENAPGGTETWAEWDRMTEGFLRDQHCAERGHAPEGRCCPSWLREQDQSA